MTLFLQTNPKPFEISDRVNSILKGRINTVDTLTLTANVGSTTITTDLCNTNSIILLMPTTANAATEYGAGTWRITAGDGSFTVTHVNNAQTDRTFTYVILG